MEAEMASQRGDADTGEVEYTVMVLEHLPNVQALLSLDFQCNMTFLN